MKKKRGKKPWQRLDAHGLQEATAGLPMQILTTAMMAPEFLKALMEAEFKERLGTVATVRMLRKSGVITALIEDTKGDDLRWLWSVLKPAHRELTVHELGAILAKVSGRQYVTETEEEIATTIKELICKHPDTDVRAVCEVMETTPRLRKALLPLFLAKKPDVYWLSRLLVFPQVRTMVYEKIMEHSGIYVEVLPGEYEKTRTVLFTNLSYLTAPDIRARVLLWMMRVGLSSKEELRRMTNKPGLNRASRTALKWLEETTA